MKTVPEPKCRGEWPRASHTLTKDSDPFAQTGVRKVNPDGSLVLYQAHFASNFDRKHQISVETAHRMLPKKPQLIHFKRFKRNTAYFDTSYG